MPAYDRLERKDHADLRASGSEGAARANGVPVPHPAHPAPDAVPALQRSIGNAAVVRLLTERRETVGPAVTRTDSASPAHGGANVPVQREIKWHRQTGTDLVAFGQSLSGLVELAAQTVLHNADSVPVGGSGHIDRWHTAYRTYLESGKKDTDLVHARFGYAVEAVVQSWLETDKKLDHLLPDGYTIDFQVGSGNTRPDIRLLDSSKKAIAWFDVTSTEQVNHVLKKDGSGWTTKDYVAEVMYPKLDLSNLSPSDSGPAGAAKRRGQAKDKQQRKEQRIQALGKATREVYDSMTATSAKDKQNHFEVEMGKKVGDGAKLAPAAAKALLSRLNRAGYQRPEKITGKGRTETTTWPTAFGYSKVKFGQGGGKAADEFLDKLALDTGMASLSLS
ncbi:hypothetical protein LZ318_24380 [Saccharopolyspora indica]|uniref:hypothetical protein n=1 Tax=Saccharopolyspora indica TaxID=1229659 RepID=UPI0022EA5231|nr:hypothetical protein [Saccharopolyspora indica]MDA3644773.1 hypothetical protein [Saccharopolyspora indica]